MIRKYLYRGPGYFLGGVTAKDLDKGTKKVARGFNWLIGKVRDTFNTVVTAGASSDFGQTSPYTTHRSALSGLRNSNTIEEATRVFMDKFERSNKKYTNFERRLRYANS